MKTRFTRFLPFLLFAASAASAGDFQSVVMQANSSLPTITVPGDRFLVIRNFTQEAPFTIRGTVSVTTNGLTTNNALSATILDSAAPQGSQEVINNIVVGGPAQVNVTCGDSTCFISYRKG